MKEQEILDNAPDGATHVTCGMYYWKWQSQSGWRTWCDVMVMWKLHLSPTASAQSLNDIRRIAELEQTIKEMTPPTS